MATDTPERAPARTAPRSPSSSGPGDGQAIPWGYAPAPEARDVVKLSERDGLVIGHGRNGGPAGLLASARLEHR